MRTLGRAVFLLSALWLTSGCALFTEPLERAITLSVDRASYLPEVIAGTGTGNDRQFVFTVIARFANGSRDTVYLERCFPDSLGPIFDVWMEAPQESAFGPAWACVGHDQQHAVAPGSVRVDTLRIFGPNARSGITGEIFGELSGRMFLQYPLQSCRGDGECGDLRDARSQTFTVESVP